MDNGSFRVRRILADNGVPIDDSQMELLERYCRLLLEWNRKINLISRKSEETIWEEQILQSLSFLGYIHLPDSASVIDIGTGGGLPGIPLKIMIPGLKLTLLDSIRKKVDAVSSMIEQLHLKGVEAHCARAEDFARTLEGKSLYEYAICRSVGALAELWNNGSPLLVQPASGNSSSISEDSGPDIVLPGSMIALKGGDIGEELRKFERNVRGISITVIEIQLKVNEPLKNPDKKVVILHQQTDRRS